MGIKLTGVSSPFGGISWEYSESEKECIKKLFVFLESKRLLVNPISMEIPDECAQSALEIKHFIVELMVKYSFSARTEKNLNSMIGGCNEYLDGLTNKKQNHIIYKNGHGDWYDADFSLIMKKIRSLFRENIEILSQNYEITFNKNIPQEY